MLRVTRLIEARERRYLVSNKICTADEAMANVHDGAHIAAHFWGICGTPGYLLRALVNRGVKDLTVYFNNFLPIPEMLKDFGWPDPTILLPQLKKMVTAFLGTRVFGGMDMKDDFLGSLIQSGQLQVESTTHGTLMERLHAGAMGLGAFYNPVGLNSVVEKGKEKRIIDGEEYILEKPIRPDVGLIKAYKADKLGNLVYRGTARGSNPVIAMACKLTIAEVFEVVEAGELDPEMIVTPGGYVDRIVRIPDEDIASEKRRPEVVQKIIEYAVSRALASETSQGGQ